MGGVSLPTPPDTALVPPLPTLGWLPVPSCPSPLALGVQGASICLCVCQVCQAAWNVHDLPRKRVGWGGRGPGGGLRKLPPFEVSRMFRPVSPKQTSWGPDDKGRKGRRAKSWRVTRLAHPSRSQPPGDEAQKRGSPPCQPLRAECPPGLHAGTMPPAGWHVASHSASQPCPKGVADFEGDPRQSVHCTFQGSQRQL